MIRTDRLWLAALALVGCATPDAGGVDASFISPANGQTGVPVDLPLRASSLGHGLPPDLDVGAAFQVVDLDHGGDVDGAVAVDDDAITFTPRYGWDPDTRYTWTFTPPAPVRHGPHGGVAPSLAGAAAFSTGGELAVLEVVLTRPKRMCLLLSRPATEDEVAAIGASLTEGCCLTPDEPIPLALERLPAEEWGDKLELDPREDPGLDVVCHYFEPGELLPGAVVKVDVGASSWWEPIATGTPGSSFDLLRRATCEPLEACPPYPSAD